MNKKIYITTYFPPIQTQQTAFCPNPFLQSSNQNIATISTTTTASVAAEQALATAHNINHYQYPTNFNIFYPNNPHHQSYHLPFSQINNNNLLQYQQQLLTPNQVKKMFVVVL